MRQHFIVWRLLYFDTLSPFLCLKFPYIIFFLLPFPRSLQPPTAPLFQCFRTNSRFYFSIFNLYLQSHLKKERRRLEPQGLMVWKKDSQCDCYTSVTEAKWLKRKKMPHKVSNHTRQQIVWIALNCERLLRSWAGQTKTNRSLKQPQTKPKREGPGVHKAFKSSAGLEEAQGIYTTKLRKELQKRLQSWVNRVLKFCGPYKMTA